MEKENEKGIKKIIVLSIIAFLILVSIICTYPISKAFRLILDKWFDVKTQGMVVHYIDVGQGDAIAIQFPNQEIMLIDSGTKDSQNVLIDYLNNNLLNSKKDKIIDYVILTHSDVDHSGGLCAVFSNFEVKKFYRPNIATINEDKDEFWTGVATLEYAEVINTAYAEKNIKIEVISDGVAFMIDDVKIEFFGPLKYYGDSNQVSPMIKISYSNKSFLFAGDTQYESELDVLNKYGEKLRADVLKVAHHGSGDATSSEFLNAVDPDLAIISVGANNTYGHPANDTMLRLLSEGVSSYRTDENGDIRILCNKNKLEVLNDSATITREFIDWWKVGLVIEIVITINLILEIIRFVKKQKEGERKSSSL